MNITWGLIGAVVGMVVLSVPPLWMLRQSTEKKIAELKAEGKTEEAQARMRQARIVTTVVLASDAIIGFILGAFLVPRLMGN